MCESERPLRESDLDWEEFWVVEDFGVVFLEGSCGSCFCEETCVVKVSAV